MPTSRYRSDLIELAWEIEKRFGLPPGNSTTASNILSADDSSAGLGLISGGVTLPDPSYEWEPFYGVGVIDRNFYFPVQGREVLEGSIPTIYLTHDNSRVFLEQIMGLIFNATETDTEQGVITVTTSSFTDAGQDFEAYKNLTAGFNTGTTNVLVYFSDGGGAYGAQTAAHDDLAPAYTLTQNATNDYLAIGSTQPFTQIRIDLAANVQAATSTMLADFPDSDGNFIRGNIVSDGTDDGTGVSMIQDGIVIFDPPPTWRPYTIDSNSRYWVRLSWDATWGADTVDISDIDVWVGDPTHIIIAADTATGAEDEWKDTFAFIGPSIGTLAAPPADTEVTVARVFTDYGLTKPGFHGKQPPGGATAQYTVHRITRSTGTGILADATGTVNVRESLVQPTFTLGARFTAEDGTRYNVNYMGNKISRATFNFEENAPVTFSVDFIGQDMRHDLGAATSVLKYDTYVAPPRFRRVVEQPYFFSRATLQFGGTTFARFRRLALVVDNQLDPRYYVTQGATFDNRQILYEILEGRRQITATGTVDLDDTLTDAQFLRWLLNQGFTDTDVRDMATLQGISMIVELQRLSDASSTPPNVDKVTFTLPSGTRATNNTGLVFRSAPHPIPAPPAVHHEVEIDVVASSMQIEIADSTT